MIAVVGAQIPVFSDLETHVDFHTEYSCVEAFRTTWRRCEVDRNQDRFLLILVVAKEDRRVEGQSAAQDVLLRP